MWNYKFPYVSHFIWPSAICSHSLLTVTPTDSVEHAVRLMRTHTIRRLLVVEEGKAVGIVSLGDLAVERDPDSVLGEISAAPPDT